MAPWSASEYSYIYKLKGFALLTKINTMDAVQEPVSFEQFLIFKKFQQVFHMQHFQIERDENGRLVTKSRIVFYTTCVLHICFFIGIFIAIGNSLYYGLPSDANLPVLAIGSYFTARGIIMYIRRHDIINFLNILDGEFPRDLAGQEMLHVSQVYGMALQRHKYVDLVLNLAVYGFCSLPPIVYMFTKDLNGPITVEQQLLGSWLPFGLRESHKAYPVTWFYDVLCSVSGTAYFATFDTLFYTMHGQIIMHMNCLSRQLDTLNWTSNDETQLYGQLRPLIRRHQHINLLCDQFNDIFNGIIMISDLIAATTICFHLYLLTETDDTFLILRYLIPTVALIAFTFEICLRGAQLS